MEKGKCRPEVVSLLGINSSNSYYWAPTVFQALCLELKWLGTEMMLCSVECKCIYWFGHCGLRDEIQGPYGVMSKFLFFLYHF